MATNNNGNLLDSAGEVAIDFVWGNMPMQPNDARDEDVQGDLSATLDNHVIAYAGWNGYPQYTPNDDGAGVGYVNVPSVLGVVTATAQDTMDDAGLTVTVASAATNTAKTVTAASRASGSHNLVFTASGAGAAYAVGTKVTVSSISDTSLNGTYTVTDKATNTFTVYTTATTTVSLSGQSGSVVGVSGTIKTQSVASGAATIAVGQAVTLTPWA